MNTLLSTILTLGLLVTAAPAQNTTDAVKDKATESAEKKAKDSAVKKTKEAAEKTAETADRKTKEAAAKTKETATKKTKPAHLSDADKERVAEAKKEADALTPAQRKKLLGLLNSADAKTLEAVEGIGAGRAKNLIEKRPYAHPEDAVLAEDIGIETFKQLCASVKPAAKTEKTKEVEKTDKAREKTKKPE